MKTLIVDDEPIARQVLREELAPFAGVILVGESEDGPSALKAIRDLQPDLVFLDLQMPEPGGLDVIRALGPEGHIPLIVIVTAWDRYAIQAMEAGAIDYLLKPVGHDRLALSVERALKLCGKRDMVAEQLVRIQDAAAALVQSPQPGARRRIVAKSGSEYLFLNADDVLAFEADGDIVWIVTARKRYLATQTLRAIQEKLGSAGFRRVHRNALVNVEHIRKMSTLSSQRWLITLSNNQEFIVSKRQARMVRDLLAW